MNAQLSLSIQKQYAVDAGRMYRAAAIVDKKQIRRLLSGCFEVISQSRVGKTHKVNPRYEECDCKDCHNGNVCMHLLAWKLLLVAVEPQPTRKTYDFYLAPRVNVIAQREQQVKAERAKQPKTEWVEELDYA